MWFHVILIFIYVCANDGYDYDEDIESLTHNLYENLKAFPHYEIIDGDLSDESKYFIDRQIDNFIDLMLYNGPEVSRKKRSFLDDAAQQHQELHILDSIVLSEAIPVNFPEDISVFQLKTVWYVAILDSSNMKESASELIIYQYKDKAFNVKTKISIKNGLRISTINLTDYVLLMVAENVTSENNYNEKSGIYTFDGNHLVKIQSLDINYASDVNMWRINDEIYMSVAQFMSNKSGNIYYEVEIPIYKWMGRHFDSVQTIPGTGVKKVVAFEIYLNYFLAVANFKDDKGSSRQYSEIYKYDFETKKYILYQGILTYGCTDIEVFDLPVDQDRHDYFLIVANSQEIDEYQTNSIIYKYVEGYFIPFQTLEISAITQWLPFKGNKNEFVLLAATRYEGLRCYQYDGWSFQEIPLKYDRYLNQLPITSIRRVEFNNSAVLVVSNKNSLGGLFELAFRKQESWHKIYNELVNWCEASQSTIFSLSNPDILQRRAERADMYDFDEDLEQITDNIDTLRSIIDDLNIANRAIHADEIFINNTAFISNFETNKINDITANDFLDNVLHIEQDIEMEQVEFEFVESESLMKTKQINGKDLSSLLHSRDNLSFDFLTINGPVRAEHGLEIYGQLNNVVVDEKNILLKAGNQTFIRPLFVNIAQIGRMTTNSINGANMTATKYWQDSPKLIDRITNLTVKDLTISGYLNDVDIPVLDNILIKRSGNQEITAEYMFDELIVENLELQGVIDERDVSELVPIDDGAYEITHDVIFNNIAVKNMEISVSLNEITVHDGKLDILVKDSTEEQQVTAEKSFENVILDSSISLQGNIESEILRKMNPAIAINDNLYLKGDKSLFGPVEIENLLNVQNIMTPDSSHSLMRLKKEGVSLNDKVIKPTLHFKQQLNVGEIFVDSINEYNPTNFVTLGTDEPQIVDGLKIIEGDLVLNGNSSVRSINNINVEDLNRNIIKITNDQIITGEYHIKNVTVDQVFSDKIMIGDIAMSEQLLRNENLTLILESDLTIDEFEAKAISVEGLVNGIVFEDIIDDVVFKDGKGLIGGRKTFENLSIHNLTAENGLNINSDVISEVVFDDLVKIDQAEIENIHFNEYFNGIYTDNFGKVEVDEMGARVVTDEQKFDKLVIYGKVFINKNKINDIGMHELVENTLKIDEAFTLESATFNELSVNNSLILNGHIENFDLDNIVWASNDVEQVIWDEKLFENTLSIAGNTQFQGFVNDFNITQFCDFAMNRIEEKNLTIRGNAFFTHGPKIANINNINVTYILENAWFKNQDAVFNENIEFEDVIFEKAVFINGFLDNISVGYFSENYLSKTKDQVIPSTLNFRGGLIFENGAVVSDIGLNGFVNDINLAEFVRNVLLNDYDQVFETMLYLENCSIVNLAGDFLVNGLNLDEDVMRYDKTNMVTGKKYFENLNVGNLKLDKNIKIQDVDILSWINTSVMTNTDYNITGDKTFHNAVFRGNIRLGGVLNDIKFNEENILLQDIPQNITGHKIFINNGVDPVRFKGIKLKGRLNGIDLSELTNNQAYEDEFNIIKSGVNFRNHIQTNNLIVRDLYQGINVTELISNITNLEALNNILDEYKKLQTMSQVLKKSVQNQAFFLDHYKTIQTMPSLTNSIKIIAPDGSNQIGVLVDDLRLDIYGWEEEERQFVVANNIKFTYKPDFVTQVLSGRYLYVEHKNGLFMRMSDAMEIVLEVPTNKTEFTTSFVVPSTENLCTLFIYRNCNPKMFCEVEESIKLIQILDSPHAHKAETITVKGVLYLIIMNHLLEDKDSQVDIWIFNTEANRFQLHQSCFIANPQSLSTATFNGFHYLVLASGYLKNVKYSGSVGIWKFDDKTQKFVQWENLEVNAPNQVALSILPSNELVLYVLTDNRAKSLLVYRYEGIAGFKLIVKGSVLPRIAYMNQFVGGVDRHFIVAQSYEEINIIQAFFKGVKVDHD